MLIGVTGATGFLGRYIANHLTSQGHRLRCWRRPDSNRDGFTHPAQIEWIKGKLNQPRDADALVEGCDAVIHAALERPGAGFRGAEGDVVQFAEANILGTLVLIEASIAAQVRKFIFISTCAVHERILEDRRLDEAHPLWPSSHYGAHKAAIEKFVHSYGLGRDVDICSLRPTGIYGCATPVEQSKWFDLVRDVKNGADVSVERGGKEVHAADVAKACEVLLSAKGTAGQAYNCYDRYISDYDVANLAKELTGSASAISGGPKQPKHQIDTSKLRGLGMTFGGEAVLEQTVREMLAHA